MISRGVCAFTIKAELSKAAGALATVIYNNQEGIVNGSGEGDFGVVVSITQVDGQAYVAQINGGATVTATVNVDISRILTYVSSSIRSLLIVC